MRNADISLAKKRKARELLIYVIVQTFAMSIAVSGLLFEYFIDVQNDRVGITVFVLGAISSGIMALGGCARLAEATFLPISIRLYGRVGYLLYLLLLLSVSLSLTILGLILLCVIPLYGLIPQFYIARWLEKEAKDGTIGSTSANEDNYADDQH
jgi:hypothetical protein